MRGFIEELTAGSEFLKKVPFELVYIIFILIIGGIILGVVAFLAGFSTYIERKVSARIQSRIGPNRVGPYGLLQFIADGIKLILKEDIIPATADKSLFRLAPYVVFIGSFAVFAGLAFAPDWLPADLNIGIFYVISISSVGVIGIIMAGWASGNKYSLFGAMRSAAQIVSYEIPIGLSILTIVMIVGSLGMQDIISQQSGGFWKWFIFRFPPFTILAFLIYYISALAECNRTPFDIPEAESELVAGFHTEYSGIRFAIFFMAEYANMFAVSIIATTLFLGGWNAPYPGTLLGSGFLGRLEGLFWLFSKSIFLVLVMMWIRWTLPRYRVDQLMHLCWKVFIPFAIVNIGVIGVWMFI